MKDFRYLHSLKNDCMNQQIRLIKSAPEIKTNEFQLTTKHADSSSGGIDILIYAGKKNWQVEIKNFMGHYGHFWESAIFDFGNYFGFVQWYEHTRGGHNDASVSIIDKTGNLLGTHDQSAGNFNVAACTKEKVWLLHRDSRIYQNQKLSNFSGSVLVMIDLEMGMVEKHIPIQVPDHFFEHQNLKQEWLTQIGLTGIEVKFCEFENEVCLEFAIANYQRDKNKPYESFKKKLSDYLR
jgi:hypothetical protein